MSDKKSKMKDKAAPFAAGAVVTAGAIAGVAAAKALSDKKTRNKIVKEFNSAKKQATKTVSDVVDKRGEMLDMVKDRAEKMMPKREVKKAVKKVSTVKKSPVAKKVLANKSVSTKKTSKKANHVTPSSKSSASASK